MSAVACVTHQQPTRYWTQWTDPVAPGAANIYPRSTPLVPLVPDWKAYGAILGLGFAAGALWWASGGLSPNKKIVLRAFSVIPGGLAVRQAYTLVQAADHRPRAFLTGRGVTIYDK